MNRGTGEPIRRMSSSGDTALLTKTGSAMRPAPGSLTRRVIIVGGRSCWPVARESGVTRHVLRRLCPDTTPLPPVGGQPPRGRAVPRARL